MNSVVIGYINNRVIFWNDAANSDDGYNSELV
ncbi:hypothetical protein SAMN05216332_11321 [Nitrosospira briensis]|nr:hypothetical protein SAMN05216332_11321 [Nitrosospira briensis]